MTHTAHTPTPWVLSPDENDNNTEILASNELSIATTTWSDQQSTTIDAANAAHIVKCVNENEALHERIAELEAALRFYADVSKYPAPLTGGMGELWSDCGETARSALAKAGA